MFIVAKNLLDGSIKKLGFGFMRLPKNDAGFDLEQVNKMVDVFMENGYTYFDTAYVYAGSEEALRETLVKRYPRDSFTVATKLNMFTVETSDQLQERFDTSCTRMGVDYVDFYLLHGLNAKNNEKAESLDAWNFVSGLKAKGAVRHLGFSFHGPAEELRDILSAHPEAEFVQLQINYLDWDSDKAQSRAVYETAREFNIPIVIMEPVKGGALASDSSPIAPIFKKYNPNVSVTSWALRFAASLDGVLTTLSGMSALEHTIDNINTVNSLTPLSVEESALIAQAVDILNNIPRIPCTTCEYCVEGCPAKIKIPNMMRLYSDYLVYQTTANVDHAYELFTRDGTTASTCIECKKCEDICPQTIEITDVLKKLAELFDK